MKSQLLSRLERTPLMWLLPTSPASGATAPSISTCRTSSAFLFTLQQPWPTYTMLVLLGTMPTPSSCLPSKLHPLETLHMLPPLPAFPDLPEVPHSPLCWLCHFLSCQYLTCVIVTFFMVMSPLRAWTRFHITIPNTNSCQARDSYLLNIPWVDHHFFTGPKSVFPETSYLASQFSFGQ